MHISGGNWQKMRLVQALNCPAMRPSHLNRGGKDQMDSENHLDLEIALRKIHELAMEDGDLGYAYWYRVGRLLQQAVAMQAEIDSLGRELERCRAMHAVA